MLRISFISKQQTPWSSSLAIVGASLLPGAGTWFGHCRGPLGVARRKKSCVHVRFTLELSCVEARSRPQAVLCSDGPCGGAGGVRNLSWSMALETAFQRIGCQFSSCCIKREKVSLPVPVVSLTSSCYSPWGLCSWNGKV